MKRLQLILSIGFLTLGLSLSVGLAYIRYGLDKVSGTFLMMSGSICRCG